MSRLADTPAPSRKALAIGDRINISGTSGSDSYEVMALDTIDGATIGLAGIRLQVVTGRIDGAAESETVRFIFAVDGPAITPAKPDRTL